MSPAEGPDRQHNRSAEDSTIKAGPIEQQPMLGPYRLLELIGQGGMGEVWLAEQKHPMWRRVAIKLIKAGMDTREVVARFESERQALALMDHPGIAKVFEAGSTPHGRPYFVWSTSAAFQLPITATRRDSRFGSGSIFSSACVKLCSTHIKRP